MSEPFITVEGKKAIRLGEHLFLKENEWLAIEKGEIIDREDYHPQDLDFLEQMREWATMTVERRLRNARFGKKFRVRVG